MSALIALGLLAAGAGALSGCDGAAAPAPAGSGASEAGSTPAKATRQEFASGLVVEDLMDGSGQVCQRNATVEVDFKGMLEDGRVFDSSEIRRTRLTLPLGRPSTIEGLREGIPGMRVGGKRRITIPWPLAYGEQGRDPIPPMANLTFEITLLRIVDTTGGAPK